MVRRRVARKTFLERQVSGVRGNVPTPAAKIAKKNQKKTIAKVTSSSQLLTQKLPQNDTKIMAEASVEFSRCHCVGLSGLMRMRKTRNVRNAGGGSAR
jgi:hypothetical protein